MEDNAGAETPRWIETSTRVVNSHKLCYEERQTDADWGDEGRTVLLCSKHEDGQDQLGCEKYLKSVLASFGRVEYFFSSPQ